SGRQGFDHTSRYPQIGQLSCLAVKPSPHAMTIARDDEASKRARPIFFHSLGHQRRRLASANDDCAALRRRRQISRNTQGWPCGTHSRIEHGSQYSIDIELPPRFTRQDESYAKSKEELGAG